MITGQNYEDMVKVTTGKECVILRVLNGPNQVVQEVQIEMTAEAAFKVAHLILDAADKTETPKEYP